VFQDTEIETVTGVHRSDARGLSGKDFNALCGNNLVNIELLRVQAWIGFDEDRLADHLFHLL
jgi:hypothetical protein